MLFLENLELTAENHEFFKTQPAGFFCPSVRLLADGRMIQADCFLVRPEAYARP